ncbi:SMI1/KNR4 family protein [Bacillus sp. T33-2]|uniref:SMI1/KNR4 family protein n=1 Tax=Bacillus sp. T33-2 TaxID=2054168 RepID=UPI000C7896E2|nr:SMI1/KNR4 family protein [Bacillus sp. T33-2]PLR94850.1 hypothetical protein CVD19_16395 [Bacillus sp. T33-2]
MREFCVNSVLDELKSRLDEKHMLRIHGYSSMFENMGFTFNEPTTIEKIEKFMLETNFILPPDYKNFLLMHNGVSFFTYEYGDSFSFYPLEKLIDLHQLIVNAFHSEYIKTHCFPIGYVTDMGPILIDYSKTSDYGRESVLLLGID